MENKRSIEYIYSIEKLKESFELAKMLGHDLVIFYDEYSNQIQIHEHHDFMYLDISTTAATVISIDASIISKEKLFTESKVLAREELIKLLEDNHVIIIPTSISCSIDSTETKRLK